MKVQGRRQRRLSTVADVRLVIAGLPDEMLVIGTFDAGRGCSESLEAFTGHHPDWQDVVPRFLIIELL